MQGSISHFLKYTFFISNGLCRRCELHTSIVSQARTRRLNVRKEPGLSHIKSLYEDDPELLENLEQQDVEPEEMNLMKSDLAFDDHTRYF